MPGKYSGLRDQLEKVVFKDAAFQNDEKFREKVEKIKAELAARTLRSLALEHREMTEAKAGIREDLAGVDARLEALNQLIVDRMEGEGTVKTQYEGVGTLSIKDDVYASIDDKEALNAWIDEQGATELRMINFSQLSSQVKEALVNGNPIPMPGVKAFMKVSVGITKA